MKAKHILLISCAVILFSCRKQHAGQPIPEPGKPIDTPITDVPSLKLKDVVIAGLPSPYYHFDYNDSGYVTKAIFDDGLSFYNLFYTNKKLAEMAMNQDVPFDTKKDKLEYDYDHGSLKAIRVIDKNGVYYKRCLLTFSGSQQLKKLEWDIKIGDADFTSEEIMQFSYYDDGNLEKSTYQSFAVGMQTAGAFQEKFENYDDKLNADCFSVLHVAPLFLHFVLLPSVHLQINNARRVTHTGDGDNYVADYAYTYDAKGRPVLKKGDVVYANGPVAGQHVSSTTTFSYYD